MDRLISGAKRFRRREYPVRRHTFERLAKKTQSPMALMVTCADSRVIPTLFTDSDPGELFLLRNAGNLVPPYSGATCGAAATIEYSVAVLNVKHIIVCGHSQCGAMTGILNSPSGLEDLPSVASWFAHAESTRRIVHKKYRHLQGDDLVRATAMENVLVQLGHLRTHPHVASRLVDGEIQLHGWYYDIGTGGVFAFDAETGEWNELNAVEEPAEVETVEV